MHTTMETKMPRTFLNCKTLEQVKNDPRVADVESEGADDGRVFVHLKPHFRFQIDPQCATGSITAGSTKELREKLRTIFRVKDRS